MLSFSVFSLCVLGMFSLITVAAASSEPEWHYADAYWRWDIDDRGPDDPSVFTGTVRAKWELHSSCDDSGIKGHSPTISSSRLNGHDDYLDPNTINIYNHAKSSGLFTCNAQSRVDFTIHRHGKYGKQTMILRFPDICIDFDCSEKDIPNVQCLEGPAGNVVAYRGKWIDPCLKIKT